MEILALTRHSLIHRHAQCLHEFSLALGEVLHSHTIHYAHTSNIFLSNVTPSCHASIPPNNDTHTQNTDRQPANDVSRGTRSPGTLL